MHDKSFRYRQEKMMFGDSFSVSRMPSISENDDLNFPSR